MSQSNFSLSKLILAIFGLLAVTRTPVLAQDRDFRSGVFAILESKCVHCHGEDQQEARLRLDGAPGFRQGGISGHLIGERLEDSLLWKRINEADPHPRMPLDEPQLTSDELEAMRLWISGGAVWPQNVGATSGDIKAHWSYVTPQRPTVPRADHPWPRRAIDSFVITRMLENGLQPAVDLDRARWLRRLYLDLVGYSPSPNEVEHFVSDTSADAEAKQIDRLLASPQFAVKWARDWLDLARYADTNGYQADQYRSVWPYRDWVVNAIDTDMPFDQFTIEQLAGDLLPNATVEQKIATGFHRLTTCNVEAGVDPEQNRVNQVIDRVNTTATVWLGTTLECAQCHNHKFDPFSQRDYYQLFAYLNNTPIEVEGKDTITYEFVGPFMDLPLSDEQIRLKAGTQKELALVKQDLRNEVAKHQSVLKATKAQDFQLPSDPKLPGLRVVDFKSRGGASFVVEEDGSIFVSGENPAKDTYEIELLVENASHCVSLRLDALTDERLPKSGPGRPSARPNFVLQDFRVELTRSGSTDSQQVEFSKAQADFHQKDFVPENAIDNDLQSGWAISPQFGKPHWAVFQLKQPIDLQLGDRLQIQLVQNHGGSRTLGRFRITALSEVESPKPAERLAKLLAKPFGSLSDQELLEVAEHAKAKSPQIAQLLDEHQRLSTLLTNIKAEKTLTMLESANRETFVFKRGDFSQAGDTVRANTPVALPRFTEIPTDGQEGSRLELARWLVHPQHPLTARVTVNRWWGELFGRPLVATPEDFGSQGEMPIHPELLDYLACRLIELGWSRKELIREIVSSRTYRQSSSSSHITQDPENKLLSRGPRRRMSAEMIRDNALSAAGILTSQLNGPPVFPPQPEGIWNHTGRNAPTYDTNVDGNRFRRGLYVFWRRSAPYPTFVAFDAPDRASCVVRRSLTNTSLQALTLLNDPAFLEIAWCLAEEAGKGLMDESENWKAVESREKTATSLVANLFRRCVSREATADEMEKLKLFYWTQLDSLQKSPTTCRELAKSRFGTHPTPTPELAAIFVLANALLNLDETINIP